MDEKKLKALATEFAKNIKTEDDLNLLFRAMKKVTVEAALNAELSQHLGHEKGQPKSGSNTRNGYSSKTVISEQGPIELDTPRDREGSFEPQLVKKHQTRITQMDSQILFLYAKGMTTREIVSTFKEMYCPLPLKYVSWKDYKGVTRDLKAVYQSATEEAALQALSAFSQNWDDKYPQISKSWRAHWENLNTFFAYPSDIRKAIYTTNAIESLNSVIRHAIKKRKLFPTDDSVRKVIYLAIQEASKKWSMPIRNWRQAMSRFIIEFEDRLIGHI